MTPNCLKDALFALRERLPLSVEAEGHLTKLAENGQLSPKILFEAIVFDNLIANYSIDDIRSHRFLEKTPDHVRWLDVILQYYPSAKVINIVRNPEEAILSRRESFPGEDAWDVVDHVQQWKTSILSAERINDPQRIITVRLEDLVANEIDVMQRIGTFAGISIDIDRLNEASKAAELVTLPWEHWKRTNRQQLSGKTAERRAITFSDHERRLLTCLARDQLRKYGYTVPNKANKNSSRQASKRILIVSPVPSHPQTNGKAKRIFTLATHLRSTGYRVHFFYYVMTPDLPVDYRAMLEEWTDVHIFEPQAPSPASENGCDDIDDICEDRVAPRFSGIVLNIPSTPSFVTLFSSQRYLITCLPA